MGVMERMFQEAMGMVEDTSSLAIVPVARLAPRPQPRRHFDAAGLEALAESIRAKGVLEPLLVRPLEGERYEIIAGERRYRAAQMVGLETVPAIVLKADQDQAKTIALIENLQREDLNPYEETVGILELLGLELAKDPKEVASLLYRMRDEAKGKVPRNVTGSSQAQTVEGVFRLLGKMNWESFVRNRLPLLALPKDLKQALEAGAIAYTVALELKKVSSPRLRQKLLKEAQAGLTLRELRAKVREVLGRPKSKAYWYHNALTKLRRVKPESLPEETKEKVQRLIRELFELLEKTSS